MAMTQNQITEAPSLEHVRQGMRVMSHDDRIVGTVADVTETSFAIRPLGTSTSTWLLGEALAEVSDHHVRLVCQKAHIVHWRAH